MKRFEKRCTCWRRDAVSFDVKRDSSFIFGICSLVSHSGMQTFETTGMLEMWKHFVLVLVELLRKEAWQLLTGISC